MMKKKKIRTVQPLAYHGHPIIDHFHHTDMMFGPAMDGWMRQGNEPSNAVRRARKAKDR